MHWPGPLCNDMSDCAARQGRSPLSHPWRQRARCPFLLTGPGDEVGADLRQIVADSYIALANTIVLVRRLLRRAWNLYRWDTDPVADLDLLAHSLTLATLMRRCRTPELATVESAIPPVERALSRQLPWSRHANLHDEGPSPKGRQGGHEIADPDGPAASRKGRPRRYDHLASMKGRPRDDKRSS
jgi:hypothetical protein